MDLSRFNNSRTFDPGAGVVKRTLWYFTNALFFLNPLFPFRSPKPHLLRLFVARMGQGVVIHPGVNIKFPWKLTFGDHSWIGQSAWLDNLDTPTIDSNVVISQGAMIIQASHDYKKLEYPTYTKPVVPEDGSWMGSGDLPLDRPDRFHAALVDLVGMGQDRYNELARGALQLATEAVDDAASMERYRSMFGR